MPKENKADISAVDWSLFPWKTLLPSTKVVKIMLTFCLLWTKETKELNSVTTHVDFVFQLSPHKRHFFCKLEDCGVISHIRLTIYPDGGVSRIRCWGVPASLNHCKL